MLKDGWEYGKQKWRCRIEARERQRRSYRDPEFAERKRKRVRARWAAGAGELRKARYWKRKDEGVCTRCGGPLLSEALCWDCLSQADERRLLYFQPWG